MATINGKACVANGRNLYLNSKAIEDDYARNSILANITVEPFDSTTNMWHIVAAQGVGAYVGIYLPNYADWKIPDNSDWSFSADMKGTGEVKRFGIESGSMNPIVGTIGAEWSRISQTGYVDNPEHKTIVMYFDTTSIPLDVFIKLPKLEIGKMATPLTPAPVDKVFSNGVQVYGRNLISGSYDASWKFFNNNATIEKVTMDSGEVALHVISTNNFRGFYTLFDLPSGDYTISVDVKGTGEVRQLGWEGISNAGMTPTSEWQRVSRTGSIDSRTAFVFYGTMDVYVRLLKVEKGTTATPWTPAPEDVM